jgi:hypothetical protein
VGAYLRFSLLKTLWVVILVLGVSVYTYHRIIRPRRLRARAYQVREVIPETEDVWTVIMAPPEAESIPDID